MSTNTPFIVGAYASLPKEKSEQEQYYALLRDTSWIDGIEIPYPGDLATDEEWLYHQLSPSWKSSTITAIPGTMVSVWDNPVFGLASTDPEGSKLARQFTEKIRATVNRLADKRGGQVIARVQLHSAPTNHADRTAYRDTLGELTQLDWSGAQLVTEHCDSPKPGQKPEKGFLTIEDEISVAQDTNTGIHINWGRSCLEERDPKAPLTHVELASKANVLAGVLFSGAGPEATQYGYEWIDGHLPSADDEPTSLMTADVVSEVAKYAVSKHVSYLGAKICVPQDATLTQRLAMLQRIYEATQ